MNFQQIFFLLFSILFFGSFLTASAQETGTIKGTVFDSSDEPLTAVNITIQNTNKGTTTDSEGTFTLSNISPGSITLVFSFIGFEKTTRTVTVKAGETTRLSVELTSAPIQLSGIRVTALRPDQLTETQLREADVREANPRDSGELLRNIKGVDAVRRGPVGLDPVVRGLRETEVGTYLDGTRIFPGGPARMDSPLSHLDPTAIETIEVVKGPYALTWGAGNMSAVRVETQPLTRNRKTFGGNITSGFDSNLNAIEEAASVHGSTGKFGYSLHGAWREGNDFDSGSGQNVPADFLSREIRGKIGYAVTPNSYLGVSIGFQNQEDIDYPGRLLDADFFDTYNYALNWEWNPEQSVISSIKTNAYINNIDHGMDNDEKPTGRPDPDRTPPFALDVAVDSETDTRGGMLAVDMDPSSEWNLKSGFDIYSTNRDATRFIRRRDNQNLLFTDLMWPDATITDIGIYTKSTHNITEQLTASGTLRLDFVNAEADTISQFFEDNISTDLDQTETNVSGSFTLSYIPADNWTIGAGIGSVVRTADATERYSDRIPASKAQTSAEFVGNPSLDPERSTQGDLWIDARYDRWNISANIFARHMNNFVTLSPTSLPKRLPLSPDTVFQYINGEANFWGFDISSSFNLIDELTLNTGISYLWGKETTLDEPALGVQPFGLDTGLRYESGKQPWFVEGTLQWTSEQNRVAVTRGETPTDGYVTLDLKTGITLWEQVSLQGGIENITDKNFVNHLNAKNPFNGRQIFEPGRVFHLDLNIKF